MKSPDLSLLDLESDLAVLPPNASTESVDSTNRKIVCLLIAQGEPREAILAKLGVTNSFFDKIINSDSGIEQIVRLQSALFPDPQQRIKRMANMALDTVAKLMLGAKSEQIRGKMAVDLLDRAGGKAVQRTENVNVDIDNLTQDSLDRALAAQKAKLDRLELVEARVRAAKPVNELKPVAASPNFIND